VSRWKLKSIQCKSCRKEFKTFQLKTGVCPRCQEKISNRKYYLKNKNRMDNYSKIYRKTHTEECKKRDRNYYLKNIESFALKAKQRYIQEGHVKQEKYLSSVRKPFSEWTTRHTTHPKKKARLLLQRAVKKGRIKKPCKCSKCNKKYDKKYIDAHHRNYKKWWKVIWLCHLCHVKLHFRFRMRDDK